jgi:hypothetical protein
MKPAFFVLLLSFLMACKKDNNSSQPVASFRFKANGALYDWGGATSDTSGMAAYIYKSSGSYTGYTLFSLEGFDHRNNGDNAFSFDITMNALHPGVYTYVGIDSTTRVGECKLGSISSSKMYYNSAKTDSISVTVTTVENGYVGGSFSGSLTHNGTERLVITEGQFQHLQMTDH